MNNKNYNNFFRNLCARVVRKITVFYMNNSADRDFFYFNAYVVLCIAITL